MAQPNTDRLAVTNKSVFAIAVPTALGYLSTPLVGIADTAIVGQLGEAAFIGGVAVAAVFIGLLLTTFNFLRFATSALIAQAFGAGDDKEIIGVAVRSCLIALVAGLLVIALAVPILAFGLWAMQPSAAVSDAAAEYFEVRVFATPFTLLNYVVLAWLVGTNRPGLSFVLQTFLNVTNIALTYYLVLVQGMGIAGAAWGTVLAEFATVCVSMFLLIPALRRYSSYLMAMMLDRAKLKSMMVLNSDIMVRSFCLFAAFTFFTRQSAQQGDVVLAANEILLHFFMVAGYFLDGFAVAAEQFIGRAIGAKNRATFEKAKWLTGLWNVGQAAALSVFFLFAAFWLIDLMTVNEDVRAYAQTYYLWAIITPLVGVLAFQMDGIFVGATWSQDMRNSMLQSLIVMIAAYFALFPLMDNHGLWLALNIFLSLRGITLFMRLKKREREIEWSGA